MNRLAPFRYVFLLVLAGAAFAAQATNQGLQAQPNLKLQAPGSLTCMTRLSDGGLVIGGDFIEVDGATRNDLARLHTDGSLDTGWHADANAQIVAVAADAGDNVYAGGDFTLIGGQSHSRLARIDAATGAVDAGFSIDADDEITALAYDGNGHLYVGGFFTMLGGQAHAGLARITLATKSVDAGWNVDAAAYVYALQADANFVYVAEYASLRRVSGAGVVDAAWQPAPDGAVQAIALAQGKLYAGGNFSNIAGAARSHLARFTTTGAEPTLDAGWTPPIGGSDIGAIAADGSGNLYVSGSFGKVGGTSTPLGIAKISDSGSLVAGWSPDFGGAPGPMVALADGRLVVGGLVFTRSGPLQAGLLRLGATDGSIDSTYLGQVYSEGEGSVVRVLSDGSSLVGGEFVRVDGVARRNLLHLHADGSLDTAWTLETDYFSRVIVEGTGAYPIYIAGNFRHIGSVAHASLARASLSGALDPAWSAELTTNGLAGDVYGLVVDGNHLYVAGQFDKAGGAARSNLAQFSTTTGALESWAPVTDDFVQTIAGDGAGHFFIGGYFGSVNGTTHPYLAKIDAAGVLDATWSPAPNNIVRRLLFDAVDGKLYVAGSFSNVNGNSTLRRLVRVSASGSGAPDTAWLPGAGGSVTNLVLDATGWLYFSGFFAYDDSDTIAGVARTDVRHVAGGAIDGNWAASISTTNPVDATRAAGIAIGLAPLPGGGVIVTGIFNTAEGAARHSLAALGDDLDHLFANGFE